MEENYTDMQIAKNMFDLMYSAVRSGNAEFKYSYLVGFAHALMLLEVITLEDWDKVQRLPEVVSVAM